MGTGRYIAFEGAEGCGKSTQAQRLADELSALLTRETGGTAIGQRIRDILHDIAVENLEARSEALLTAADRAQHLAELVVPALIAGRHVVSDRSVYSALAYQGYGRCLPVDEIRRINDWAIEGRWPDLVVLLDAPADVLASRVVDRDLDRFELESGPFFERVVDGFRTIARADPERWVIVDATLTPDAVHGAIRTAVADRLGL